MKYSILPGAELEAAEAAFWYHEQRPGLGDDFLEELSNAYDRIQSAPDSHARLEYYHGVHDVRRCLLNRFPYVVIFLRDQEGAVALAVTHAHRRPLYWIDRLG